MANKDNERASDELAPNLVRLLTVDEILTAPDLTEKRVEVPEWGGSVKVRSLTKGQQHAIRQAARRSDGEIDSDYVEILMFVEGVIEPRFDLKQAALLKDKNAGAVDRVLAVILEISGMTPKAVKEAEKRFR